MQRPNFKLISFKMEQALTKKQTIYENILNFIREEFNTPEAFIPLHEPRFIGNERKYVMDAIDSTFVSSVGRYVDQFEQMMAKITGSQHAVAVVNGTSALHMALLLAGVKENEEVITQPLTFVATANAISYTGAKPVFVDVERDTLGMSPGKLERFIKENLSRKDGSWFNRVTGRRIAACVPMHTFGLPCRIDEIVEICTSYGIPVVEDAAESLGSNYKNKHTGTFGKLGIFSFNGNKTITCGGGGAIVTNDKSLAEKAKHITTTAKKSHRWEYVHDEIGYNYRMPNLNAAMACAQLEMLSRFVENKRELAERYASFFETNNITLVREIEDARSNYWLNAIALADRDQRDEFLAYSNDHKVMTRPIWRLLNKLEMFSDAHTGNLDNAEWLEDRIVNIPSSVRVDEVQ